MRFHFIKLVPGLLLFILCSCQQKEKTKPGIGQINEGPGHKLKSRTAAGITEQYFYDSTDRLKSIESNNGNKAVYTYSDSTVEMIVINSMGQIEENILYTLNKQGFALSEKDLTKKNKITNHEYNDKGYLVSSNEIYDGETSETKYYYGSDYWLDSITVAIRFNGNTVPEITKSVFTYTNRGENKATGLITGLGFLGARNSAIYDRVTIINSQEKENLFVTDMSYEYDDKKRVVKEISLNMYGRDSVTYSYY